MWGFYGDTTVDRLYAAGECSHTGGPRPQPAGEQFPAGSAGVRPPDDLRHQPPDAARGQRPHRGGAVLRMEGQPLHPGHRTAIRRIMQKAWFVLPDYDAAEQGLAQAEEILKDLQTGGYALTTDFVEAKSLATVCVLILREVLELKNGGEPD